jgi:hypothetical protein
MPDRWAAAAYTCLIVVLFAAEPAVVGLTVHDHVQLDRVTGSSAERHGDRIRPGTTQVRLAAGTYGPDSSMAQDLAAAKGGSLSDQRAHPNRVPLITGLT